MILGMEPSALHMLGKRSTIKPHLLGVTLTSTHLRTKQEKETHLLLDLTCLNISLFTLVISDPKAASNMTIKNTCGHRAESLVVR